VVFLCGHVQRRETGLPRTRAHAFTFTLLPRCQMTATTTKERRDTSSFIILSLQMASICRLAANHDKRLCNIF